MSNLVIAYPTISETDYSWIQDVRKKHDPKYFDVVKPHVTLVFGTEKLSVEGLSAHTKHKLANVAKFELRLDSAIVVEDDSKTFFHAFLVPSKGHDEINTIHDLLYSDDLASELRLDIPFVPHLGIGTGDEAGMTALVDEINDSKKIVSGSIDAVMLVQYDGVKVVDVENIPLS